MKITYFPHDVDAFFDDKVLRLFNKLEWEGYGIFIRLIELLYSSKNHKIPADNDDFLIFCRINHFPEDITKQIIHNFELFSIKEGFIYSKRVDNFVESLEDQKEKRILAARAGGLASGYVRLKKKNLSSTSSSIKMNDNKENKSKLKKIKEKDILYGQSSQIVSFFNEITGKNFRIDSNSNIKYIQDRLREGYSIEDCKKVIMTKYNEWKENSDMKKYIRIETLFSGKFESYLNQDVSKAETKEENFKNKWLKKD